MTDKPDPEKTETYAERFARIKAEVEKAMPSMEELNHLAELEAMQAGQPGADDPAAARLDQVVIAAKAHAAAYAVERKARRARDESIRAAIQEGVTMYAIAKQTGLTEQGVRRIRDAGKSRCDIPGCTITDPHRHKPQ